jgi:hypothetical protein
MNMKTRPKPIPAVLKGRNSRLIEEAECIYKLLSDGGQIFMPMEADGMRLGDLGNARNRRSRTKRTHGDLRGARGWLASASV